jgi:inner membrane protein involved in colicin E2 resistance
VNFPAGTLSPTRHAPEKAGWRGEWRFDSLISSAPIGIELPQKLNPGPLASKMTFFAPVGLLFFFFVVAVLSAGKKQPLHPMHYFFLGCSFFAFHLLFAYLVDHLRVAPSFGIAAAVALALVVSYVRLFRSFGTTLATFGVPMLVYLVLFSSTFFWDGYTGLAIAVLAIVTLFVIMQITGRVRWEEAFAPKLPSPAPFGTSVGARP